MMLSFACGDSLSRRFALGAMLLCPLLASALATAAPPPDIAAAMRAMGPIVDPACTARLYRPLMPANDVLSSGSSFYPGIAIARDVPFGPHPKDLVDVFRADRGANARAVLIFVPGGAGNKIELQSRDTNAFYDNIGRWAARNGMVGVVMQRHAGVAWDEGAKDVARMIQWLQGNISDYDGDAGRMFIWAHSAGNMPVGTYIGRPELHGPRGVGVKGVIFMSPAPFNVAPVPAPVEWLAEIRAALEPAGKSCGAGGALSTAGALPGRGAGEPGGPEPGAGPGGPPPMLTAVDPATQLQRSSLPELKRSSARILLANAEFDPGADSAVNDGMQPFVKALHDELCTVGADRCPTWLFAPDHNHMSVVFSIDTSDETVSGPILDWINGIM
jgi:triacylglycerol lipase